VNYESDAPDSGKQRRLALQFHRLVDVRVVEGFHLVDVSDSAHRVPPDDGGRRVLVRQTFDEVERQNRFRKWTDRRKKIPEKNFLRIEIRPNGQLAAPEVNGSFRNFDPNESLENVFDFVVDRFRRKSGSVFTTLHFIGNLQMCPISYECLSLVSLSSLAL
jgi:hypothetical protein